MAQHDIIFNYLRNLSQETSHDINKAIILNNIQLEYCTDPKFEIERRSVEIEIGTDDTITATSFKLYNYLVFNQSEFRITLLNSLGSIGGFISGDPIGTVLGVLGLIGNFINVSKKAAMSVCTYEVP